jgi:hypothetical protein
MSVIISYNDDYAQKGNRQKNGTTAAGKKSLIPSSGKDCPYCHIIVANGDPDGENIPGDDGRRRHKSCAKLAVARSKDTELRRTVNLQLQTNGAS